MPGRERSEGEDIGSGLVEHVGGFRVDPLDHPGDLVELRVDVFGVGLGEDRADDRGDHLLPALGQRGEDVAHEVDAATLPGSALQHHGSSRFQPGVSVGEITSFTPERPRTFNERRNAFQNSSVSLSPTSNPSTWRRPSAATPIATTIAWDTTRS